MGLIPETPAREGLLGKVAGHITYWARAVLGLRTLAKWFLLVMASGAVNAGGFLACGQFVSHITGYATHHGVHLARGAHQSSADEWVKAFAFLGVPIFFFLGGVISALLVDRRLQQGKEPMYAVPLCLVALCLTVAAVGGHLEWFGEFYQDDIDTPLDYFLLILLCLASGIQNAVVTTVSGTLLRSSHMTGVTTDLGIGLVRVFFIPRDSVERRLEVRANLMRYCTISAFIIGSILGAFLLFQFGYLGFLVPAALALYAAWRVS
jgi:uncharacterized membrane protein YoaK (UPF0700 family)